MSTPDLGLPLVADLLKTSPAIRTNLALQDLGSVFASFRQVPSGAIRLQSMQPLTNVVEISSMADSGQVLEPKSGSFDEIQRLARDPFSSAAVVSKSATAPAKAAPHPTFAAMR